LRYVQQPKKQIAEFTFNLFQIKLNGLLAPLTRLDVSLVLQNMQINIILQKCHI